MLRVLALVACVSASKVAPLRLSKVMNLRGGMDLGPLNAGDINGALKVAAAVTAAGAITEKYAGVEETALTKMFKGDVRPSHRTPDRNDIRVGVPSDPRQT